MSHHFSTRELADILGTDTWRVRRLFEDGTLAEPSRFAGKRVIPGTLIPAIVDALRARDWLPVEPMQEAEHMNLHIDPAEFAPLIEQAVSEALRQLKSQRATAEAEKVLVDKPGAAEILSVSVSTIDRLRKEGLPSIALDGRVLFRPASLDEWAAEREQGR